MLHNIKVHSKEAGLQGGAECVALHQANLSISRLMPEQMFLGWYHVLQHLKRDFNKNNNVISFSFIIILLLLFDLF